MWPNGSRRITERSASRTYSQWGTECPSVGDKKDLAFVQLCTTKQMMRQGRLLKIWKKRGKPPLDFEPVTNMSHWIKKDKRRKLAVDFSD